MALILSAINSFLGVRGQRAFLDALEDGVVADAADETGVRVDDVLKQ
jgi:hypothetical protein